MEYIFKCPNCAKNGILTTVKQITYNKQRKPQRQTKCSNCGLVVRATLIGELLKSKRTCDSINDKDEIVETQRNITTIRFWH
jgi:uncharacterized Zn finger protein